MLTKHERIALGEYLTEYPETDYDTIVDALEDGSDLDGRILVWEPFEDYPLENVGRYITNLKDRLEEEYA